MAIKFLQLFVEMLMQKVVDKQRKDVNIRVL